MSNEKKQSYPLEIKVKTGITMPKMKPSSRPSVPKDSTPTKSRK